MNVFCLTVLFTLFLHDGECVKKESWKDCQTDEYCKSRCHGSDCYPYCVTNTMSNNGKKMCKECRTDADCPSDRRKCGKILCGCRSDDDCDKGQVCRDSKCGKADAKYCDNDETCRKIKCPNYSNCRYKYCVHNPNSITHKSNWCVQCKRDDDCPRDQDKYKICSKQFNSCTECRSDSDCKNKNKKYCNTGICRECLDDSHCPSSHYCFNKYKKFKCEKKAVIPGITNIVNSVF